jgi:hypothetical protein
MTNEFKESSERVLSLLNNAKNMAVTHQNRRLAMDILHSLGLYVSGTKFPCSPEVFEKLGRSIIDKQNQSIIEEFAKVEKDLIISFRSSKGKASWHTLKLPR